MPAQGQRGKDTKKGHSPENLDHMLSVSAPRDVGEKERVREIGRRGITCTATMLTEAQGTKDHWLTSAARHIEDGEAEGRDWGAED